MKYLTVREEPRWNHAAFRRARVEAGLTWRSMSEQLGVAESTLHRLGNDGFPSTDLLKRIAALFNVPQRSLRRQP